MHLAGKRKAMKTPRRFLGRRHKHVHIYICIGMNANTCETMYIPRGIINMTSLSLSLCPLSVTQLPGPMPFATSEATTGFGGAPHPADFSSIPRAAP